MCIIVLVFSHLYVNVIVFSLCELDEDGKKRQNRLCAEEGALRPDQGCRKHAQNHSQHAITPPAENTLPVPLYRTDREMHEVRTNSNYLQHSLLKDSDLNKPLTLNIQLKLSNICASDMNDTSNCSQYESDL